MIREAKSQQVLETGVDYVSVCSRPTDKDGASHDHSNANALRTLLRTHKFIEIDRVNTARH